MIDPRRATHVVIDTDVASWLLDPRPFPHTEMTRQVIARRARVVSFVTVAELRYELCGQAGVSRDDDNSNDPSPTSK